MIRIFYIHILLCLPFLLQSQCIDEFWHNTSNNSVWLSCNRSLNPLTALGVNHWILYEFEKIHSVESFKIWNISNPDLRNSGAKRIRMDVSSDGASWQKLGTLELDPGVASKTYTGEEFPDLGNFNAQYVLLTILENHGGGNCSGLAEVQFRLGEGTTPTEEEYLSSLVKISPNPADKFFNVSLEGISTQSFDYHLVDMTGKTIEKDRVALYGSINEKDINVSGLPDGQYSLRIDTDEGSLVKQVIVVHPN